MPIQSLKGQPQGDAHRAEGKAFRSFGKTLIYSVLVLRLICAASGPETSALGRTSYLPIGRHGFTLLDDMLICQCCSGRSNYSEHGGIHIPGDTVDAGLQRHTLLAQSSTLSKAIGGLPCNEVSGRTYDTIFSFMQVAVTQDDDSEMTGFCPEAKVRLHAHFSCEMLVQAASTWNARSEPLKQGRSNELCTQALVK